MAYYQKTNQADSHEAAPRPFDAPTVDDFNRIAASQDKKLWNAFLKDYAENFQRSIMAGMDHFLFLCPSANLVVELVKFRHFSGAAGAGSGKIGDALRNMGLKRLTFTYREVDSDFDGVCFAIDKAVERELSHKSLADIPKRRRLPLEDDETVCVDKGYKVTVSGDYKLEENNRPAPAEEDAGGYTGNAGLLNAIADDIGGTYGGNAAIVDTLGRDKLTTYGGNAGITNSLSASERVTTYGGNAGILKNDDDKTADAYSYTRFNKKTIDDIPLRGNWQDLKAAKAEDPGGEPLAEAPGNIPPSPAASAPADTAPAESGTTIVHTAAARAALAAATEPEQERPANVMTPSKLQSYHGKHIFIAKTAAVVGDVRIGNNSSVWYSAVVRGDQAPVTIGEGTNVQDGSVIHVDVKTPAIIGDGVSIGHNCTIHGCDIGDNVLVGMGSTILNRASIPDNCIVGAGSLITQGKTFPEGSLILGSPAKAARALTEEEIRGIRDNAAEYMQLMNNEAGQDYEEIPGGFVIVQGDTD
ncbi:DapH/DapD/GlmU-related protein [Pseudoramibacter sp. HA2172]|uniref:DapH/DapD/GlmU-related protein n=1 Tax=Pseudoramibacter faecis TaxID=3108534 RepID=UPI002E761EDA|nr:DapH/DapD/GlmU-related protein [Pseudoramibacter sp. HA2172]